MVWVSRGAAAAAGRGRGGKAGTRRKKGKDAPKHSSLNNRIRGLERLLQKGTLTGDALEAKKQELKDLKDSIENKKKQLVERDFSKKYHMVKFFERRKIERRLVKVQKLLSSGDLSPKEIKENQKKQQALTLDLEYTMFYPKDKKYVSLLKDSDPERIAEMRKLVAQRKQAELLEEAEKLQPAKDDSDDAEEPGAELADEDDFFAAADSTPLKIVPKSHDDSNTKGESGKKRNRSELSSATPKLQKTGQPLGSSSSSKKKHRRDSLGDQNGHSTGKVH